MKPLIIETDFLFAFLFNLLLSGKLQLVRQQVFLEYVPLVYYLVLVVVEVVHKRFHFHHLLEVIQLLRTERVGHNSLYKFIKILSIN